nr:CPBP family intramembrane glutamic endopeptidase [uncultured Methanolobus sp.]
MSVVSYYRDFFTLRNLDRVTIAGFLVILQLFVLISADYLWENDSVNYIFLLYFVMMAFSFALLGTENPYFQVTIFDGIIQWGGGFLVGLFIFSKLGISGTSGYSGFESLGLLIVAEALVIGMVEETTFRGAFPKALMRSKFTPGQARLFSAIAFSLFHVWVSDFDVSFLITAFVFGLIMQYVWDGGSTTSKKPGYPLASCGLHSAWNVVMIAGSFCMMPFDISILGGL